MTTPMSSMDRVLTAIAHREPDRVPFFLLLTLHGARELGLAIQDYFSRAENVVEGQLRMQARYQHDCFYPFFYAALEVEAWGAEVIFVDDGPPNAGPPLVRSPDEILWLEPPRVDDAACLHKMLTAISQLKERTAARVPIIGVVMSPFSLPVMQLGFEAYLQLLYEQPALFEHLMHLNEEFCVTWANAQLAAGATAICYFDPMSSPTMVPTAYAQRTGFPIAKRTIARIKGPTATHLASGLALSVIEDLIDTGTAAVGVSAHEDIASLKRKCAGRLTVLGNLNGIEMRRWSEVETTDIVLRTLLSAGPGGGFILSDNHGEIPWQVPERVLTDIAGTVIEKGRYPLPSFDDGG